MDSDLIFQIAMVAVLLVGGWQFFGRFIIHREREEINTPKKYPIWHGGAGGVWVEEWKAEEFSLIEIDDLYFLRLPTDQAWAYMERHGKKH